jgi:uncharacterized protein
MPLSPIYNTGIEVIMAGFTSAFTAQLFKFFVHWFHLKKPDFKWLFQTGGMPSSHSSAMSAMATSVFLIDGPYSVTFAIAFGIAMVVMYDAAGLRQAAGRMARILNRMTEDFYAHHPENIPDRIRELLGHTPLEVFMGALFGVFVSWAFHSIVLTQ